MILLVSCNSGGEDNPVDDFLNTNSASDDNQDQDNGDDVGNSALKFTPAEISYGDVGLGGTGETTVSLENISDQVIYLSGYTGTNSIFEISSTTCQFSGGTLNSGSSCNITFKFNAITGGSHTGSVNINYDITADDSRLISNIQLSGSAGINAPTNYQLTNVTGTTASMSWSDNSTNEVSFEVSRCDGLTCATTFVSSFTAFVSPNNVSYQFTGLTEGNYYRFRVRAISNSSQSSWLVGSTFITFGGVNSIVDNGTGATDLSSLDCRTTNEGAYVSLDWNAASDATAYFIYDASGGSNVLLKTVNAPATSTLLTGLDTNTAYQLLIRVATSTGYNSQNTQTTNITTTSFVPCMVLGKASPAEVTTTHGLYGPTGVMTYGAKLFVADRFNNRVLIWNSLPTDGNTPPNVVIGQSNFTERYRNNTPGGIGSVSAYSLYEPFGVWAGNVGGTDKLVVADYRNNRVLIWNSIPTSSHTPADVVVGQGNMFTSNADGGDVTRGLQNPSDVWSDGTRLYVADYSNNRVLIFNSFPTSNFAIPDVYLGQALPTDQASNCGSNRMNAPSGVWSDGTRLLVSLYNCQRVAIYESIPATGTNPDPDTILGQTTLTGTSNGAAADKFNRPYKPRIFGGKIYVPDYSNNRVKVWNSIPAPGNHGVASDYVLGFSNTANTGGTNQDRFSNPIGVSISGTRVYVGDYTNNRVMGFNTIPIANGTNADFLIGQYDFTTLVINDHNQIAANNFDYPDGLAYDGTQFFVADVSRNRILVWNGIPQSWNQPADFVVGQGNFTTILTGRNQSQLNAPRGICIAGGKLWVPDYNNRRVMVFDLPISSNGPNASAVLGQTTWTANTTNAGYDRVNQAIRCFYDGTKFYVVDRTYDRVLIYNSLPAMASVSDNPAADVRVGTDSNNGTSQNKLRDPWGIYSDGTKLFVADSDNHRVMVWDPIPTVDDQNADYMLGGNLAWTSRTSGTTAVLLNYPVDITGDAGGRIYVLDRSNGRILRYDNPTMSNQPADQIFGKTSYTDTLEPGDASQLLSAETRGLLLIGNQLFYGDNQHSRVLGFPIEP
ncbi:MAG: fibronectin type III domain-containing protein [Halobacteriovoraceae bacterium]|nr:fibronectin type III domain-containing protein [Halobacteriovoraceae bacterium]